MKRLSHERITQSVQVLLIRYKLCVCVCVFGPACRLLGGYSLRGPDGRGCWGWTDWHSVIGKGCSPLNPTTHTHTAQCQHYHIDVLTVYWRRHRESKDTFSWFVNVQWFSTYISMKHFQNIYLNLSNLFSPQQLHYQGLRWFKLSPIEPVAEGSGLSLSSTTISIIPQCGIWSLFIDCLRAQHVYTGSQWTM